MADTILQKKINQAKSELRSLNDFDSDIPILNSLRQRIEQLEQVPEG